MPQLQGSPVPIPIRVLELLLPRSSPLRMQPRVQRLGQDARGTLGASWGGTSSLLRSYPYRKQKITELKIILVLNSPTVKEKGKIPFIRQIPLQSSSMISRGML